MLALEEMRILVDCELYQWQYKLSVDNVQVDSAKQFFKHIWNIDIYTLVKINYLINLRPKGKELIQLGLETLSIMLHQKFPDIFTLSNVEKLLPHKDIDLAINL